MFSMKRKRGCNYTPREIDALLALVQQHHSAIEDKRTSTAFLVRKKDAWKKICSAYNTVATSGIRTVEQLKVFYDNKKQKDRKSLAENNKKLFIKREVEPLLENVTEEESALEHEITDEDQWSKTSGGNWCPTGTEHDQRDFPIMNEQVTPLPNSCDSAAFNSKDLPTRRYTKKKIKKRVVDYKQLYFKQKCQNAYLQKRKILQDIRLRRREHSMFMTEHELKLSILQKEQDEKFK